MKEKKNQSFSAINKLIIKLTYKKQEIKIKQKKIFKLFILEFIKSNRTIKTIILLIILQFLLKVGFQVLHKDNKMATRVPIYLFDFAIKDSNNNIDLKLGKHQEHILHLNYCSKSSKTTKY